MNESPADRLKAARLAAGYASAKAAAEALGVSLSTYTQHENGTRGIPRDAAPRYARRFKVAEEWLLYGKGAEPAIEAAPSTLSLPVQLPSVAALTEMFVALLEQIDVDPHQDGRAQMLARIFPASLQAAVFHQEASRGEKANTPAKRSRAGAANHSST